ncbi:2OG-Fe(II) oxygenase [Legionella quinlivanii]|uniref:2OG-Fe(II) oxygenase n=1 Tax=Legionella quinlivanii TaxID=45073 RepID=A0A0W0XY81_9GAMM|nr:2OG-Fe(II) oxygenase [Legionella quinlivanii]KTD49675.1 2OG-Fe(II) oxygenase [Legionella quinlivanii]MCW8451958.1 2OG-Fe(II) oxygenase [Legionella quinlivanii]SEG30465.1 SM-20-related protein [Legionella quinlivanii DSM 21216]STY09845.1 2OG-Fe(II) oxygenase [Legionella quinlivanii]
MVDSNLIDNLCNQGFHIIENFLGEEHARQLRTNALCGDADQRFKQARVGNSSVSRQQEIRGDSILWLDPDEFDLAVNYYFQKINQISRELNNVLFMGLNQFETHYAIYQPGTFYKKHVDQFQNNKDRRISCVYYLNEGWKAEDGGALKVYNQEEQLLVSILPQADRFICFTSDLPHEVELTHQTRVSIAGWLKRVSTQQIINSVC